MTEKVDSFVIANYVVLWGRSNRGISFREEGKFDSLEKAQRFIKGKMRRDKLSIQEFRLLREVVITTINRTEIEIDVI